MSGNALPASAAVRRLKNGSPLKQSCRRSRLSRHAYRCNSRPAKSLPQFLTCCGRLAAILSLAKLRSCHAFANAIIGATGGSVVDGARRVDIGDKAMERLVAEKARQHGCRRHLIAEVGIDVERGRRAKAILGIVEVAFVIAGELKIRSRRIRCNSTAWKMCSVRSPTPNFRKFNSVNAGSPSTVVGI